MSSTARRVYTSREREESGKRELSQPPPNDGRELEAVPGARRADDDSAAPLEHERTVGRRRIEAGLRADRLGIDVRKALAHPGGHALHRLGVRRAFHVRIDLRPTVVHA